MNDSTNPVVRNAFECLILIDTCDSLFFMNARNTDENLEHRYQLRVKQKNN